jgi:hypothetical protein
MSFGWKEWGVEGGGASVLSFLYSLYGIVILDLWLSCKSKKIVICGRKMVNMFIVLISCMNGKFFMHTRNMYVNTLWRLSSMTVLKGALWIYTCIGLTFYQLSFLTVYVCIHIYSPDLSDFSIRHLFVHYCYVFSLHESCIIPWTRRTGPWWDFNVCTPRTPSS